MKHAVRIVTIDRGYTFKLFAIVEEKHVTKYRNLAKEEIRKNPELSSSWVQVLPW